LGITMRRHTMSDREAYQRVRPRNRPARWQLLVICGCVLLVIGVPASLLYYQHRTQQYREQNWDSAVATIEDVRMKLVGEGGSGLGGGTLYSVEVLARFAVDGTPQERWIRIEQGPESSAFAQLQARLWKGEKCFVRWNPANPDQIVAEMH
jgi:hypothetical protein